MGWIALNWLAGKESNLHSQIQSLESYRWTTRQFLESSPRRYFGNAI